MSLALCWRLRHKQFIFPGGSAIKLFILIKKVLGPIRQQGEVFDLKYDLIFLLFFSIEKHKIDFFLYKKIFHRQKILLPGGHKEVPCPQQTRSWDSLSGPCGVLEVPITP